MDSYVFFCLWALLRLVNWTFKLEAAAPWSVLLPFGPVSAAHDMESLADPANTAEHSL